MSDPVPRHPDLDDEQTYLDHAYRCLDGMRRRTLRAAEVTDTAAQEVDAAAVQWELRRRLSSLDEPVSALCFGRLDGEDGSTFYIGRRHVEDDVAEPVVVDWRAPVSTPFYRATVHDSMELRRRRRFMVEGSQLLDILDEVFDDPDCARAGMAGGIPDPLLAELERARTGEMRDIVATIQAEQDVVIRSPLEVLLVVQGGPGTGKTAVGLHRTAFLLYEHRDRLARQHVLVIGPNRIFLRYIAQVLPSLGESSVVQNTIDGLVGGRWRVRAVDTPAVARLKGDRCMAEVIGRACTSRIRPPPADLEAALEWGRVTVSVADVARVQRDALGRELPLNEARALFRRRVLGLAYRHHLERRREDPAPEASFFESLRQARPFQAALGRCWPSFSAVAVVRSLLGNRQELARAADGRLSADAQRLLWRRPSVRVDDEAWTEADLPLLDEAEAIIAGPARTYGHVVVDEAQDLSAMALRMLARRSPDRSMTILGDLAQATAPTAQDRWETVVEHLGGPARARVEVLEVGYRVPGPILDFANRLLPAAAPHVRPSRSVRLSGDPPEVISSQAGRLLDAAVDAVRALATRWSSVAVITPVSLTAATEAALSEAGVGFSDAVRSGLGDRITVLPPSAAKGLEFDGVVVVEPALFLEEDPRGARLLYVAMTRAVQHLSVVHERELPGPLQHGERQEP